MTLAARKVLEDCKGALDDLKDCIQGSLWRRRWITAVVLLRTVGYALKTVDSTSSPKHKAIIEKEWALNNKSNPESQIFWKFIEVERNNIIHEYQINAVQNTTIRTGTAHWNLKTGDQYSDPPLPTLYYYTISSGPYKGRDQRELVKEAIEWWEKYLDNIDRQVNK